MAPDWVRREVRAIFPPSTNVIVVRCGLFGVGQMLFDDASLTAETAAPAAEPPVGVNLLADPGFEGDGNLWEYSLPPFPGARAERDTTVRHSGTASIHLWGSTAGDIPSRSAVCQVFANRAFAGKHVRLTAWVKTVSLQTQAYLKVFSSTPHGDVHEAAIGQINGTTDWTQVSLDANVPADAYQVWVWLNYNLPSTGDVYWDDASFEVLGPAKEQAAAASATTPH